MTTNISDYEYIRRLTLIPAHHRVLPGQTVVLVDVAPIGPIAMWPRGANGPEEKWGIAPGVSPTQHRALQIVSACEPYTVGAGEAWSTPDPNGGWCLSTGPDGHAIAVRSAGHFALLDDDGRRAQ